MSVFPFGGSDREKRLWLAHEMLLDPCPPNWRDLEAQEPELPVRLWGERHHEDVHRICAPDEFGEMNDAVYGKGNW